MVDGPRGRQPFTPGSERPTRTRNNNNNSGSGKGSTGGRRDGQGGNGPTQGPRDGNFYDRNTSGSGAREGGYQERGAGGYRDRGAGGTGGAREGGFYDRGPRTTTTRREGGRAANPQIVQHRAVHYQVVSMDDEEWGETLENRLNALGRDGWRLVAIDEGRQYVFMQTE